jgi:anti-sigma regulatory factor (Ser/Thr protein kinase)
MPGDGSDAPIAGKRGEELSTERRGLLPVRRHAHHEIELPPRPTSPRVARAVLEGWLDGLVSRPAAENIQLAATELVTNAIRHASLGPQDMIGLTVHLLDDVIRVEVKQATRASDVVLIAASDRPGSSGYGLALVEANTDRWGVEVGPPGCVWFETARSATGG